MGSQPWPFSPTSTSLTMSFGSNAAASSGLLLMKSVAFLVDFQYFWVSLGWFSMNLSEATTTQHGWLGKMSAESVKTLAPFFSAN